MTLRRTDELQVAMLVLAVVPTLKTQRPRASLIQAREHAWILRTILAGTEQTFRVSIVVAHARPAVGRIHAQVLQSRHEPRCFHWTALVRVKRRCLSSNGCAQNGCFHQACRASQ